MGLLAAVVLAAAACSDSVTETVEPAVAVVPGQVITGSLSAGAARAYVLHGRTGDSFRVRFEADASTADTLVLEVRDFLQLSAPVLAFVRSGPGLSERHSGWFTFMNDEPYLLRVTGLRSAHAGSFTLEVEAPAREIAYGDTVSGGGFGAPELFHFTAGQGDEIIVFLQPIQTLRVDNGPLSVQLMQPPAPSVIVSAPHVFTPHLESRSSGLLPVSAGRVSLAVQGRGDFRLQVRRINRQPLLHTGPFVLGTRVTEPLEHVGDIDEFDFHAVAGQELVAHVNRVSGLADGYSFRVLAPDRQELARLPVTLEQIFADTMYTERFAVTATGEHHVRITAPESGDPARATGTYSFLLRAVDRRPESVSEVATPGEWKLGEAIDYAGDVDEFRMTFDAPGLAVFGLRRAGAPWDSRITMTVRAQGGDEVVTLRSWDTQPADGPGYSSRVPVATGEYRIVVDAPVRPPRPGPYEFIGYRINPEPETVGPVIEAGVVVTGESLDVPLDVDTFTFPGEADQQIVVFVRQVDPGPPFRLNFFSGSFASAYSSSILEGAAYGPFWLNTTRDYPVTVESLHTTGAYELLFHVIDRAPESRPAVIQPNTWVTGEALFPRGDIDEFMIDLAEGDSVRLEARTLATATGTPMISIGGPGNPTSGFFFDAAGAIGTWITVHAAGAYTVRVQESASPTTPKSVQGPYEFIVHHRSNAP